MKPAMLLVIGILVISVCVPAWGRAQDALAPGQTRTDQVPAPQIADGGGYVTEFILLSAGGTSSEMLNLYNDTGMPL